MSSATKPKRQDKWRSLERHYCATCNAWMGGDRQSILIHENGKRHRDNVEREAKRREEDKLKEEVAQQRLNSDLRDMERIAAIASARDREFFGGAAATTTMTPLPLPLPVAIRSSSVPLVYCPSIVSNNGVPPPAVAERNEESKGTENARESWNEMKKKREAMSSTDGADAQESSATEADIPRKRVLGEFEGHYQIENNFYLEGTTYASVVEEDQPAQIWVGNPTARKRELRAPENQSQWKTCLIIKIHDVTDDNSAEFANAEQKRLFDVAYLNDPSDDNEVIKFKVESGRLRLQIGEEGAPVTLEEARLSLVGGEEVVTVAPSCTKEESYSEDTGLGSWGTVSVRKTTLHRELLEERAREKAQKKEEEERRRLEAKKAEERRMEEAKHANADDSALGAYDVWGAGKGGYKGIDINGEGAAVKREEVKTESTIVAFKKRSVGSGGFSNKKKKKSFRRTTSADD